GQLAYCVANYLSDGGLIENGLIEGAVEAFKPLGNVIAEANGYKDWTRFDA
ncbi:hypothetical protein AAVH_08471, partial [Aphelenchoides avenae]